MSVIHFHTIHRLWAPIVLSIMCCLGCKRPNMCKETVEKDIAVSGFRSATVPRSVMVHVSRCTEITLRAKGCAQDIADLDLKVTDSVLDIRFKNYKSDRSVLELYITTPIFTDVNFFKVTKVREVREP